MASRTIANADLWTIGFRWPLVPPERPRLIPFCVSNLAVELPHQFQRVERRCGRSKAARTKNAHKLCKAANRPLRCNVRWHKAKNDPCAQQMGPHHNVTRLTQIELGSGDEFGHHCGKENPVKQNVDGAPSRLTRPEQAGHAHVINLNTASQSATDEIGDIGGSKRTKNKRRRQMAGPYNAFGQQAIEDEQPCMLGFVSCDSQSSGDRRRQRNGEQPMKQNRTDIRPPPNSEPAHSELPCLEPLQRHPRPRYAATSVLRLTFG